MNSFVNFEPPLAGVFLIATWEVAIVWFKAKMGELVGLQVAFSNKTNWTNLALERPVSILKYVKTRILREF